MYFVLSFCFRTQFAWLAVAVCADVCAWASHGPSGELSPRASPGFGVRVADQVDQFRQKTVLPDFAFDAG